MAAQSRLTLRSSNRGSVGLGELPATVIQRNPSPAYTRKRTRDPSTDYEDGRSAKRVHDHAETAFTRRNAKVYSRKLGPKNVTALALEEAVTHIAAGSHTPPTQPINVVPQPPHDSTAVNSSHDQAPDGPTAGNHKSLATNKADKRSLRSHNGGSRFKCELALYFADYDDILGDEPKAQELLTPGTRIYIVDEPVKSSTSNDTSLFTNSNVGPVQQNAALEHEAISHAKVQVNGNPKRDELKLNNAERLDFTSAERHTRHIIEDPLTDEVYFKAHRRAERGEKSHRNREKESAQHEKSQLERILAELKSHAWLKAMGISGITDSEKKVYEPKRIVFIQRVTALLDKFRAWKEEEKRRRAKKERASISDEDEEEEEGEEEEQETEQSDSPGHYDGVNERNGSPRTKSYRHKRITSTHMRPTSRSKRGRPHALDLLPAPVDKPFTSFYAKPHLRDAALSKHRRGRLRFAFGQQVPDLQEHDFDLPSDMLTLKFIAANARSRRAAKREARDN